jgi:hypothetical protein
MALAVFWCSKPTAKAVTTSDGVLARGWSNKSAKVWPNQTPCALFCPGDQPRSAAVKKLAELNLVAGHIAPEQGLHSVEPEMGLKEKAPIAVIVVGAAGVELPAKAAAEPVLLEFFLYHHT